MPTLEQVLRSVQSQERTGGMSQSFMIESPREGGKMEHPQGFSRGSG